MSPLRFLFALTFALIAGSALAQSVVTATSDPVVRIHSTFAGQTITIFGNIEPDPGGTLPPGPYDVVVVVRGPAADRVVRQSARHGSGIIINGDYALYRGLPSFYRVLSSRPPDTFIPATTAEPPVLSPLALALSRLEDTSGDGDALSVELVRLMEEASLFGTLERGVHFLSPTLFSARVALPANVPNGSYLAQTFVFSGGEVVAARAQRLSVRTEGFERFIAQSARDWPLLYGLATVLLALATGWLGGVLFRR